MTRQIPKSDQNSAQANRPSRHLSLFDAVSIMVGTMIGAGIFELSPVVAANAGSTPAMVLIWLAGGAIALCGALCFAELTTRFSTEVGGDYVFLKHVFGKPVAFLFAWSAFWIIRPGNSVVMAIVFARYFGEMIPACQDYRLPVASAAVIILSLVNLVGLSSGKWIQNALTTAKVLGIGGIVCLPLLTAGGGSVEPVSSPPSDGSWMVALMFVMFTMGGWNDIAFVTGEIKNPQRNLWGALLLGTASVTVIYILFNVALVSVLGLDGVAQSKTVVTEFVTTCFGAETGSRWGQFSKPMFAALVCVSSLGAINGIIITSPRIYYSVGRDFKLFRFLGHWNQRQLPWQSCIAQAVVTIVLLLVSFQDEEAVKAMVIATTPYFWGFMACVFVSVIVLRGRDANQQPSDGESIQVQRMPLYPLPVIVSLIAAICMCYASINYLIAQQLVNLTAILSLLLVVGIGIGFVASLTDRSDST